MVVNSSVPGLWNTIILQNDWTVSWHGWVSIYSLPTGLESGRVYQHKNRQLHASWPQSPGKFNLPVRTYPLGPWAVWDWTQVNKSFYSDLCLSPPGATLCWGKTIQDFTLVAFCFNPLCNTHNKTSHAWWNQCTSMMTSQNFSVIFATKRSLNFFSPFLLFSSSEWNVGLCVPPGRLCVQSLGAFLSFSDLPLPITRKS